MTISIIGIGLPNSSSAQTISVSQQIIVTATILPAKYVIVDANDRILQIISNTSDRDVQPSVYRNVVKTENFIQPTAQINSDIAKLLNGKAIKPGILYDYKTDIIKTVNPSNLNSTDSWLSGIFNRKNIKPTVNLASS